MITIAWYNLVAILVCIIFLCIILHLINKDVGSGIGAGIEELFTGIIIFLCAIIFLAVWGGIFWW